MGDSKQDASVAGEAGGSAADDFVLSAPVAEDGFRVHQLIRACPPLDENSIYCNLLQCDHFADTSVKVERQGELVAFISGYIPPANPEVLFIWQVAVAPDARGHGLGGRMLRYLVDCDACRAVRYMHTTVTPDNEASTAMFEGFARRHGAALSKDLLYHKDRHFGGQHESEIRFTIGPLR